MQHQIVRTLSFLAMAGIIPASLQADSIPPSPAAMEENPAPSAAPADVAAPADPPISAPAPVAAPAFDAHGLKAEIESALEGLRSELRTLGERLEAAEVAVRDSVEQLRGELSAAIKTQETAQSASGESQRAHQDENARERDILSGSLRVVESAQGALSQRMASIEGELGRISSSSDEAHRHTATRLEAVDQRTKKLAESIRHALDSLND